jgi:hypothetical protein
MKNKLLIWFLDKFGRREEIWERIGYCQTDVELTRGWYIFGKWISYEDLRK